MNCDFLVSGVPSESDPESAHPDTHRWKALRVSAVHQVLPAESHPQPAHPNSFGQAAVQLSGCQMQEEIRWPGLDGETLQEAHRRWPAAAAGWGARWSHYATTQRWQDQHKRSADSFKQSKGTGRSRWSEVCHWFLAHLFTAAGLLRVKLSGSDRPAAFSRVVAPGAGGITTQDRATSPFPLTMMMRPPPTATPSDRMAESRAMASATDAMAAANGTDQISSNAATYLTHHGHHAHQPTQSVAAASAGPYQFVPFPHRPYPYDLLSLGPMGQSMYGNKMAEHQAQAAKYRDTLGRTAILCRSCQLVSWSSTRPSNAFKFDCRWNSAQRISKSSERTGRS